MDDVDCVNDWFSDTSKKRAETFDERHSNCACEAHSFSGRSSGLLGSELLARLLTSPGSYDLEAREIVWAKLRRVYTDGLSTFRAGCTEAEIKTQVDQLLTGGEEKQTLVGAALVSVETIRVEGAEDRWFCVYDTPSSEFSEHADIIGRFPVAPSKSQKSKEESSRLRRLRNDFNATIGPARTADELIAGLRVLGFTVA